MVDVKFLTSVPIFASLNEEQLESLPGKLQPRRYQRGEVIFHEDDPADRMHIIVEGRVKISIASEDGRERDIALFQSGDCFGEMALLDGSNRSATATAFSTSPSRAFSWRTISTFTPRWVPPPLSCGPTSRMLLTDSSRSISLRARITA